MILEWLAGIYVVAALVIICVTCFIQGYKNTPEWQRSEDLSNMIILMIGWPFFLMLIVGFGIVAGPFIGLRKLGAYLRKRKDSANKVISRV